MPLYPVIIADIARVDAILSTPYVPRSQRSLIVKVISATMGCSPRS